jgi:hypothetical protein
MLKRIKTVLCFAGLLLNNNSMIHAQEEQGKLPDDILSKKREGQYLTGVPAIAFSPDSGFIYGVVLFHFTNGERNDPRFDYTPYLRKVSLLAVQSTKGLSQFKIDLDAPKFFSSVHRIKPSFFYSKNIAEQYFGTSESTMANLRYPVAISESQDSTSDYSSYEKSMQKKLADGSTYFRYNQYIHTETEFSLSDEIKVITPYTNLRLGFTGSKVKVEDYSGKSVDAIDKGKETKALQAATKLSEDQSSNGITGYDGGTVNSIDLGVSLDTRNFEPDPTAGQILSLSLISSRKELGSSSNFVRYTLNARTFHTFKDELTIAAQSQYVWSEGDVPFWKLPGIGGRSSLKGHRLNRFKSQASAQVNSEVRWRAKTLTAGTQTFLLTPILYADYGRVYDQTWNLKSEGWRRSLGSGLRIIWNQATVIGIEKTLQGEEKSLYVNINHIF